jgi:hypothetical protein
MTNAEQVPPKLRLTRHAPCGARSAPGAEVEAQRSADDKMQNLNPKDWRAITYEGHEMPPSVMGISILMSTDGLSEETKDWIWRLVNCRGVTKCMDAAVCTRVAEQTREYLLSAREPVLREIDSRLGAHGFNSTATYVEWMESLTIMIQLSGQAPHECQWSGPSHPDDSHSCRKKQCE